MTSQHPLDRSAAFTVLLELSPVFRKLGMNDTGKVITAFLDEFHQSDCLDMMTYARDWVQVWESA